jgi:titin
MGLVINDFVSGIALETNGENVIAGNYIGTDVTGTAALGNQTGIYIGSNNNTIGGLAAAARNIIAGSSLDGVELQRNSNVLQGNYIGTDVTGRRALGNYFGVFVNGANNTIGGTTPEARNIISGNTTGVDMAAGGSNQVQGNYIGTDVTGTRALGNIFGLYNAGAPAIIGGTSPGAGNLISGNTDQGLNLFSGHNVVQGNLIGTDVTGRTALGNGTGVYITGTQNTVGGAMAGARNVISGNMQYGVEICNIQVSSNLVLGNYIGTDITGAAPVGNVYGVYISGSSGNTIGGEDSGAGNVISGNFDGVMVFSGDRNVLQGNFIGTSATGNLAVANLDGVDLLVGSGNMIGGSEPGAGNVISGNTNNGVVIFAVGNFVQGNLIGSDKDFRPNIVPRVGTAHAVRHNSSIDLAADRWILQASLNSIRGYRW